MRVQRGKDRVEVVIENWKPIEGFDGRYEVSNLGRIRSLERIDRSGRRKRARMLKLQKTPDGRHIVGLHRDGESKSYSVSRLVARAFIGCGGALYVCHNNGNKADDRADNLRYDTQAGNCADKIRHGTWQTGERIGTSKLTDDDVREIRRRRASGELQSTLASEFGIGQTNVSWIVNNKTWRHVK
jgi:hypothetical protein